MNLLILLLRHLLVAALWIYPFQAHAQSICTTTTTVQQPAQTFINTVASTYNGIPESTTGNSVSPFSSCTTTTTTQLPTQSYTNNVASTYTGPSTPASSCTTTTTIQLPTQLYTNSVTSTYLGPPTPASSCTTTTTIQLPTQSYTNNVSSTYTGTSAIPSPTIVRPIFISYIAKTVLCRHVHIHLIFDNIQKISKSYFEGQMDPALTLPYCIGPLSSNVSCIVPYDCSSTRHVRIICQDWVGIFGIQV